MPNKKISELNNASPLTGAELIPIVQPVVDPKETVHVTIDDILALGVGITNSAINNELTKSDGINLIPSGIFSSSIGNLQFGSNALAGDRTLSAINSTSNAKLILSAQSEININTFLKIGANVSFDAGVGTPVTINWSNFALEWHDASGTGMTFDQALTGFGSPIGGNSSITGNSGLLGHTGGVSMTFKGGDGFTNGNAGNADLSSGTPNGSGTEGSVTIQSRSAGKFGIFAATPVVKQSAVTTAQGIADALTAYGFIPSSTISGSGSSTLAGLTDVNISSLANLDLLQYQTSDSKWHNITIPTWNQNTTGSAAKWTTARNLAGNSVDGSANVAFVNKFIIQGTTDTGLSGAQFLGALGTGIVKNTTTTGVLSIAIAADFPTLNQSTTGSAATLTTGRTISITGDIAYTSPSFDGSGNVTAGGTLATVNSNIGSFGSATQVGSFTVNGKGLLTAASNVTITPGIGSITGLGAGVATWLATPSWTNFNSAITGTVPYWSLASGGTLTGVNTIISNSPSQLIFNGSLTTTANSQFSKSFAQATTLRGTVSDTYSDTILYPSVTLGSTTQNPIGLDLAMTYIQTGGVSTTIVNTSTVAGMTATTYTSVAPASTSGSGTSALFTVVVSNATTISSITQTTAGSGYKVNETITFNGSQFGSGSGSAVYFIRTVTGVSLGTSAAPLRVSVSGSNYLDAPKSIDFYYQGSEIGSIGVDNSQGIGLAFYDNTSVNFRINNVSGAIFSKPVLASSTLTVAGAMSLNNTISSNISIGGSTVTTFNFTSIGPTGGFTQASSFASRFKANGSLGVVGLAVTVTLTSGGTGYTTGTKTTTGSATGTGATITINTVSGGVITAIATTPAARGTNYVVGDVLTLSGGTGGTVTVTAVDYAGSIIDFDAANSYTDAFSNNKYINYFARPIYNITSSQAGAIYGFLYQGTHTSTGSFGVYNFVYENTGSKGGIGQTSANTNATWMITGSGSIPTFKTVGAGTTTNYSWRAFQSDGTTEIFSLLDSGTTSITGNLKLLAAGNGLYVKEGSNATMGLATLSGGTVVVSTNKVTASSRIMLTGQGGNITNLGSYGVTTRSAGTSFTITSSNVLDTNTVGWIILEPA